MKLGKYENVNTRCCPECKKILSHIRYQKDVVEYGKIYHDPENEEDGSDSDLVYESSEFKDGVNDIYFCPECNAVLTNDIDEAKEFISLKKTGLPHIHKHFHKIIITFLGEDK